ncbi:hypothetical protein ACQKCH_10655 [Nubsella zeaxanthinifaciens]|uniref:hypothetical protein n=1 Tax=Nubsella zeaxanthinifaciens TaxID=392412 RepID=UPI003D058C47
MILILAGSLNANCQYILNQTVIGKTKQETKFYLSKDTTTYTELFSVNRDLHLVGVEEKWFKIIALGNRFGYVEKIKIENSDSLERLLTKNHLDEMRFKKLKDSIKDVVNYNEKMGKYKNATVDPKSGEVVKVKSNNSKNIYYQKKASEIKSHLCGYPSKSKGFCKRTVLNGRYCWQHGG